MSENKKEILLVEIGIAPDLFSVMGNFSKSEFDKIGLEICEKINEVYIDIKSGKIAFDKVHRLNIVSEFKDKSVFINLEFKSG